MTLVLTKMHRFVQRTVNSNFVRNVAIVATGTAGAQGITMAFAPIITRLYGPEAFGVLGVFSAIAAIVTPIAALAYPIAIVLPKEDSEAKGIGRLSSKIAVSIACVLAAVLMVTEDWLVEVLNLQAIGAFILLIPLVMLFSAWMQIARQWLIRKKQFHITARVAVLQALILNSAKTGLGLIKPLAAVLIVLSTMGSALSFVMLSIGIRKAAPKNQKESNPDLQPSQWDLAKKYYDFPMYRAPQMVMYAVSQSLPVLLLAAFSGPASAGFYTICMRLLGMPVELIGRSVGDVFYPRITQAAHRGEKLTPLLIRATMVLSAIGFAPFALVVAIGPWLFGLVFGEEWVVAGQYARWLSFWMFVMFIMNPSIRALPILSAQGFHLVFTVVTVIVSLIVLAVAFYVFNSDVIAVALLGVSCAFLNMLLVIIVLLKSVEADKNKALRGT